MKVKIIFIGFVSLLIATVILLVRGLKIFTRPFVININTKPLENKNIQIKPPSVKEEKKEIKEVAQVKNEDIKMALKEAINQVGGIKLPKKESIVLIKPALNSAIPYPGTTSPLVVAELTKMAYGAGAKKVIVADQSGAYHRPTMYNFEKTGIKKEALSAGAEVRALEKGDYKEVKIDGVKYLTWEIKISKIIDEVDYIISVPTLKTHASADFSLSLKNTLGLIPIPDRLKMHASSHLKEMIGELNAALNIDLVVIDGTRAFKRGGPDAGLIVDQVNTIIASTNRTAADLAGYNLLRKIGAKLPEEAATHSQIKTALEIGIRPKEF